MTAIHVSHKPDVIVGLVELDACPELALSLLLHDSCKVVLRSWTLTERRMKNFRWNKVQGLTERITGYYRSKLREKAISRTKARIASAQKEVADFSEDELEEIVYEEEEKVKRNLLKLAVAAVLLALGVS